MTRASLDLACCARLRSSAAHSTSVRASMGKKSLRAKKWAAAEATSAREADVTFGQECFDDRALTARAEAGTFTRARRKTLSAAHADVAAQGRAPAPPRRATKPPKIEDEDMEDADEARGRARETSGRRARKPRSGSWTDSKPLKIDLPTETERDLGCPGGRQGRGQCYSA